MKSLIDALGFLAIRVARLEPGWWDRRHLHGWELIKIAIRAHVAHRIKMNLIQNVRMRKDLKRDRSVQREMCSIIEAVVRSYSAGRCLRLQVILHIHSMTHTETLNSQECTSISQREARKVLHERITWLIHLGHVVEVVIGLTWRLLLLLLRIKLGKLAERDDRWVE